MFLNSAKSIFASLFFCLGIILLKILSTIIKFKHCLILLLIIFPHQNRGDPHLARVELKLREASV
nr:MAG TPA: hypothetical protein [Caudoviricetes sp.]